MAKARAKEPEDGSPMHPDGMPAINVLELNRMISKGELAVFLGRSEGTLDQWASRGGGPDYHIVGKHRMYLPADVKAWLDANKRTTASGSADAHGSAA